MKFITKDDDWGIRATLKELFKEKLKEKDHGPTELSVSWFDIFFNQFLPPPYYETKSTVLRHIDEIKRLIGEYKLGWVWIERKGQYQCAISTNDLDRQIKDGMVTLPTYFEIEEEKKRWQNEIGYRKEEGFSNPIKEEMIQLKIVRR